MVTETQTWSLDLSGLPRWDRLPAADAIPRLERASLTYDEASDRLILHGGLRRDNFADDTTYALSLAGPPIWTALLADGTARAFAHAAIYDARRDQMVVFGGIRPSNGILALTLGDTPAWSRLESPPRGKSGHITAYDDRRHRMILWGGTFDTGNQVFELSFDDLRWRELPTANEPPALISGAVAFYDSRRDRVLIYGGHDGPGYVTGIWELSLQGVPSWRLLEIAPGPNPGPRVNHAAAYDPVGDRWIVFGGVYGSILGDTWALELSPQPHWVRLPDGPEERWRASATYDPVRRRMLLFGGLAVATTDGSLNDVWALDLDGTPSWRRLYPGGEPPTRQFDASVFHDPVRDRLIVSGGYGFPTSGPYLRTWALSLDGEPVWTELSTQEAGPSDRNEHAAVYDPIRDRMIFFGGNTGFLHQDTWSLDWGRERIDLPGAIVRRDDARRGGQSILEIVDARDSGGALLVDASIARPGMGRIELFDVGGRKLASEARALEAGTHRLALARPDDAPSGVYFLRLAQAGSAATRRVVLLR